MNACPATREAVIERELEGEWGCPLCGRTAEDHHQWEFVEDLLYGVSFKTADGKRIDPAHVRPAYDKPPTQKPNR